MVGETHLAIGEELVVHQGVAIVDRAKRLDLRRSMHDEAVNPPFEEISEQKSHGDDRELPPTQFLDIAEIHEERREADDVDDGGMKPTIVPSGDPVTVRRPVVPLS